MSTPRVSFYALKKGSLQDALLFACRLTDKAQQLGHRVHILARDEEQLRQLDELLWQFRPESFIPHQCLTGAEVPDDIRVTLGTGSVLPEHREVLICLAEKVWEHHGRFTDIREIVPADESERVLGRQRYRFYQEQGYPLETKQLPAG